MKTKILPLLIALLALLSCKNNSEENNKVKQVENLEVDKSKNSQIQHPPVKSTYSIPSDLQSIKKYANGYTTEETMFFRQSYGPTSIITANDTGSYGSSNLNEVTHTTTVHRMGQVSKLISEPNNQIANVRATTILGTMTLSEMMDDSRSRMKAIAVIHDGKLVFEKYLGIRDWDNHLWASATKIFSGTLMHIAEEEGLVNLKESVVKYLPELKGTDWDNVKVEDALHMRSGLDISESRLNSSPEHPVTLLYAIAGGDPNLPEGTSLIQAVKKSKKRIEPGIEFEYASINTHVCTLVLERVYNMPIEDLITTRIWGKSGMEGDAILGLSASGEPMSFGAFAARLRDLGRFGMLFTPSYDVISKEKIISDNYFNKALEASRPETYGNDYMSKRLTNDFGESNFGASYQWDAVFPDGDMYKSGRTGQCLYVSPKTNTVVVWYSSAYMAEVWVHAYARKIVNQLYREK